MDEEEVELEKSNILLMGPTGSGNLLLSLFWLFDDVVTFKWY
jgi:ATP-dependent protease Clp ATPase subunit